MNSNENDAQPVSVFWFRRDLRLEDNAGLYHALKSGLPVLPIFIFDTDILHRLDNKHDARVSFIYETLKSLHEKLAKKGSSIRVYHGTPIDTWEKVIREHKIKSVFANHDYEPGAIARDAEIQQLLLAHKIPFHTYKDQVIFEKNEVLKPDGKPYTIYTPYSRKWKEKLTDFYVKEYPVEKYLDNFLKIKPTPLPALQSFGFEESELKIPPFEIDEILIRNYHETRDLPGIEGTTRIGPHLRFGTVSIRRIAAIARELNSVFLNELIWREFYMMILYHFPHVVSGAFHKEYDQIAWDNNEIHFQKWCEGKTGFPIVDAGMLQLNTTGYMHNRVRMITASFLTKHLLIDWRWGEQYFASKLLDYELASNNGGWQWSAGTGCDAAPYFRIFNPDAQTKKFDIKGTYIRKWVTEFGTPAYPKPIIDLKFGRGRALVAYKKALKREI